MTWTRVDELLRTPAIGFLLNIKLGPNRYLLYLIFEVKVVLEG